MIKANELRVGNKIRSIFGRVETVRMILGHEGYKDRTDINERYKHLIGVDECRNQYNLAEIFPIELQDEHFVHAGFQLQGKEWLHPKLQPITFEYSPTLKGYFVETLQGSKLTFLKHLHQLQNLYFILTGEELQVNF